MNQYLRPGHFEHHDISGIPADVDYGKVTIFVCELLVLRSQRIGSHKTLRIGRYRPDDKTFPLPVHDLEILLYPSQSSSKFSLDDGVLRVRKINHQIYRFLITNQTSKCRPHEQLGRFTCEPFPTEHVFRQSTEPLGHLAHVHIPGLIPIVKTHLQDIFRLRWTG
ncbi:hypothetical protein SAMN05421543_11596 [Alicyclobacillus macrosporangiidus]|uniref:Uncharacterized protein n=1 Tax=Alicyclobacillus macrosporangiidus TaxID=392015 RepID=A0A1I7KFC4_9BACL|nr:hypothetical protein SAMN05421543_11596 [Alicyclobacillus macrosporangiidus]